MMTKLSLIALATALVALALLAYSFMPQELAVPSARGLNPAEPENARAPTAMRVLAFDAGSMSSRAALAFRGGAIGEERLFGMGGVWVQHPKGTLLFDTGLGRDAKKHVAALPWLVRSSAKYTFGTPLVDQLERARIDWRSLAGIVLTHAHWDHVSGVPDMPGIPVWLNQEERDFVWDGRHDSELLRGLAGVEYRVYGFPDGPYMEWKQSYDVFKDGSVVLVPAGGHTPGSVIAFISPPTGQRFALIGDIAWQREGVDLPAERPWLTRTMADHDPAAVRETLVRLHRLQKRDRDLLIVPAHDARAWAALPHALHSHE